MKTPRTHSPTLNIVLNRAVLLALLGFGSLFSRADDLPPLPQTIPANVRFVLENRCILCHDEVLSEFGRLDMKHWVDTPDGRKSFVNVDASGKQYPSSRTFQEVLNRISTDDTDFHMPLGYTLKPDEDGPLRTWLNERLKAAAN
jgi:hypothetical protein